MIEKNRELVGAMIGLARVVIAYEKTQAASDLLLEAFTMFKNDTITDDMIIRIHEEKYSISPGCRSCKSPCGNTDDYDFEDYDRDMVMKQIKTLLWYQLVYYGSKEETYANEKLEDFIYNGLYTMKEEWDYEFMMPVVFDGIKLSSYVPHHIDLYTLPVYYYNKEEVHLEGIDEKVYQLMKEVR